MGIAWDNSNAYFLDTRGNDVYDCENKGFCIAQADHNSFAFFNDKQGRDTYHMNVDRPVASNTYNGGKSVAIFLDEGGRNDRYYGKEVNDIVDDSNPSFLFLDLSQDLRGFVRSNALFSDKPDDPTDL
tara:strand:+ start:308 stop:691 length:384 start_codon:yes stop_codon:yes gene_type:complete